MQDGAFDAKIKEIDRQLLEKGLDSLGDRDLQLLMLNSQNKELEALKDLTTSIRAPFWKLWTYKELATAFGTVLALLGLINWDKVNQLFIAIASASGAK